MSAPNAGLLALSFPEPLLALTRSCEVQCVVGCCGLDALEVSARHIESWVKAYGLGQTYLALTQLEYLMCKVSNHTGNIISDEAEFNAVWPTSPECLDFLDLWQREILEAIGSLPVSVFTPPGTVVQLAQVIHNDRAFDRLPILADALEDAGCTDPDTLAHCRGPGPHVRGCWVVDLLLGKS